MDAKSLRILIRRLAPRAVAGFVLGSILILILPAAATSNTAKVAASPTVSPINTPVGGVAPAEWTVRWWRWTRSFPHGLEPYMDRDGSRCALEQDEHSPVWFLAGTNGRFDAKRSCQVPLGKHLLVPVINMYYQSPRSSEDASACADIKEAAAVNNDALVSAVVVLDGKNLGQPARLVSRCFDPYASDRDSGPAQERKSEHHAAADGYWVLLPPLSPGKHHLVIGANYGGDGQWAYSRMIQNFEYELQIGDPQI